MTSALSISVDVWSVDLDAADFVAGTDEARTLLSAAERNRAARYVSEVDRRRAILRRAVLRELVAAYTHEDPCAVVITTTSRGKPELGPGASLRFSLSHRGGRTMYAFRTDGGEIGIDLELDREVPEAAEIVRTHFSAAEEELYRRLSPAEQRQEFLRLWTCKEAVLKATGDGITQALASIVVPPGERPTVTWRGSHFRLQTLRPDPRHVVAVAARRKSPVVRLRPLETFPRSRAALARAGVQAPASGTRRHPASPSLVRR